MAATSSLPVELTCPLGSQCETVKDGKIMRCAWFTKLAGTNPQTGETVDEWGCAIAWLPIVTIENAQTNRGQTEAICSLRDETIARQDRALGTLIGGIANAKLNNY